MKNPSSLAFALAALALSATASAQTVAQPPHGHGPQSGARAQHRPQMQAAHATGRVARYLAGPMGHVRALVLADGTAVFLPPFAGDQVAQAAPVGQNVTVDGFASPQSPRTVLHARITLADGRVLGPPERGPGMGGPGMQPGMGGPGADPSNGPRFHGRGRWHGGPRGEMRGGPMAAVPPLSAAGSIQQIIAGPRGNARVLLLSDGATVFLAPGVSRALGEHPIRTGLNVRANGHGNTTTFGPSLVATELRFDDGFVASAPARPAGPPGPGGPDDDDDDGPGAAPDGGMQDHCGHGGPHGRHGR